MKLIDFNLDERNKIGKSLSFYANLSKAAVVICFILICAFSLLPAKDIPHTSIFPFGDKGAHAIAYAGFGFFAFLSISLSFLTKHLPNEEIHEVREIMVATFNVFLVGLPLGLIIEFIQSRVGRTFDLYDWLADAIGLIIGCIFAAIVNQLLVNYKIKQIKVLVV
jgi:VanZ family protein